MEQTDFQKLLDEYNKLYITYLKNMNLKKHREKKKREKIRFLQNNLKHLVIFHLKMLFKKIVY